MAASHSRILSLVPAAEGEVEHVPALVTAGEYLVKFSHWHTCLLFGKQGKLAIVFTVCDLGAHFGTRLLRWYNVRLRGKSGHNGKFSTGWGSDLLHEYVRLVGMTTRCDRIALTRYSGLLIRAKVETVTTSRTQGILPDALHYSVIRKLLSIEAGKAAA